MAKVELEGLSALEACKGRELVVSDWLEVTQQMVDAFAEVTGDPQWIHIDVTRSRRESPFGTTIAHGFLTVSLLSLFLNRSVVFRGTRMGVNYGFNKLRFTAPVKVGSRLRARFRVDELEAIEGGTQILWGVTMECEGQKKPVLVAEWLTRRYN
ncbi:MAG: MaoC family dehydratase [Burkholderiales bacterium]